MPTRLPLRVPALRRTQGRGARAGALALPLLLLLLPLLTACGDLRGSNFDATMYVESRNGPVYAIDAATGAILWQYYGYTANGLTIDPARHKLFLSSTEGTVAALEASTGKLVWHYDVGGGNSMNKPYLVGSMIVAAAQPVPGSLDTSSVIVALGAGSGTPQWRVSLPGLLAGDLDVHNDRIYASVNSPGAHGATGPGAVYALRTADGAQVWRAAAVSSAALVAGPVSDQTQVYASASSGVALALRASDGALQWSQQISASGPLSAIFATSGALYVGDGSRTVHALSKTDGSVLWTRAIAPNPDDGLLPPLYTPSDGGARVLLTSATTPIVYALSPRDGTVVWSQYALGTIMQPPFVLGDDVYLIASSDIEVLSLANGAVVADLPFVFHAERYTPDEQEDLSQLDFLVVAPPRGGG